MAERASRDVRRDARLAVARAIPELSVVIPAWNERENVRALLPRLDRVLREIGVSSEVVVVDGGSTDGTAETARSLGADSIPQDGAGYGGALRAGFRRSRGQFVLTLDADLSHDPDFIGKLWRARDQAEVVIASRYVKAGVAYMPAHRKILSRILNRFFASGLALPIRDLSSGFRLYRKRVLDGLELEGRNFDVLEEILVKAYAEGWRVREVPFTYHPRDHGSSNARIVRFGIDLLRAFVRLWRLRNSIESADYDERAFYSRIPFQRYWQRKRHEIITRMARDRGKTLDVGCGSSVILQSLNNAIGLDVRQNKMRYMRSTGIPLVLGSVGKLPVASESFDCVVCSQVIEHLPSDVGFAGELDRVLKPGGLLVLGTPDYDTVRWPIIERLYGFFVPGGYKDEHVTHYTRASLVELAEDHGLQVLETRYVFGSELILALGKAASDSAGDCASARG